MLECKKCRHKWKVRKEIKDRRCPKCKTRYWENPKQRKTYSITKEKIFNKYNWGKYVMAFFLYWLNGEYAITQNNIIKQVGRTQERVSQILQYFISINYIKSFYKKQRKYYELNLEKFLIDFVNIAKEKAIKNLEEKIKTSWEKSQDITATYYVIKENLEKRKKEIEDFKIEEQNEEWFKLIIEEIKIALSQIYFSEFLLKKKTEAPLIKIFNLVSFALIEKLVYGDKNTQDIVNWNLADLFKEYHRTLIN